MKKVVSILLCVMLFMAVWSMTASAMVEGDFGYETAVGGVGIVNYYKDAELVILPDTLGGQSVRSVAGFKRKGIKEVVLPDTLWEIGQYAFSDCDSLESVTIPENVTAIRQSAFSSCDGLKRVELPEGLVTIEESAFYSCDELCELYIPKSVKSVGKDGDFRSAFSDEELKNLKIVVDSENEYYKSDDNGWVYTKDGKVLLMACSVGANVEIPQGVTEIADKVFYKYGEIQKLVLPEGLEKIGKSAFAMCADIKEMELPDSIRYIDEYAFSGCWWLKDVTIGTKAEYIGNGAFMGCGNLTRVTFLNHDTTIAPYSKTVDMSSARRTEEVKYDAFHLAGVKTVYGYKGSTAEVTFGGKCNFIAIDTDKGISDKKMNILTALGIFEGYEDGDFKEEANLSRAEAAAVMVRVMNKESEAKKGETAFSDIDKDHWASGYISLAAKEKIINGMGDGTFKADEKVTYHQFIKMLCCVMGYDIAAEARGGWAKEGYISIAEDIRLTKGIVFEHSDAITRADAAKLVYNALETELMDENAFSVGKDGIVETDNDQQKTIITEYFDYQDITGTITDATTIEVTGVYKKSQGYYKKGDCVTFTTALDGIETLIGKSVMAYMKKAENGESILLTAVERP